MAWLRNRRYPANFDPTFTPTFPVALIPDHPLANGLCGLYFSADGTDYSPMGNNGVATSRFPGTVTLGQAGTLLSFNGTNQAFVGGGKGLNTSFATISVWVYGTTGSSIYPLSIGTSTNYAMYFQMTFGSQASLGCFTSTSNTVSSVASIPVGVLTHLCGTFNSTANLLQCYVNGVPTASTTTAGTLRGVSNILVSGLYSSSTLFYYSQNIASASVYNRALTAGEVYALYREPYDMLAPVARRSYTKSQIVPDSLSISATAPKPKATFAVAATDQVAVAATTSMPRAALALNKGESLHVTPTTRAPIAALSAKTGDMVAVAATAPKPNAATSAITGTVVGIHATTTKPIAALAVTAESVVAVKATTKKPSASVNLEKSESLSVAATTHPPTATVLVGSKYASAVVARTTMPTAKLTAIVETRAAVATTVPLPHAAIVVEKGETVSFVTATTRPPTGHVSAFQQFVHIAATTTLPPLVHFPSVQLNPLSIAATTLLPNRLIGSEEGESALIGNIVTPMPNMMVNALAAEIQPDRDMIILGMLGNIVAKASVSAT